MSYSRRQRFSDGTSGLPRVEFAREFQTAVRTGVPAAGPERAAAARDDASRPVDRRPAGVEGQAKEGREEQRVKDPAGRDAGAEEAATGRSSGAPRDGEPGAEAGRRGDRPRL